MNLITLSFGYCIENCSEDLLTRFLYGNDFPFFFQLFTCDFVDKPLFVLDKDLISNKVDLLNKTIYYPSKSKFYKVRRDNFSLFVSKYFSTRTLVNKEPEFYACIFILKNINKEKIDFLDKLDEELIRFINDFNSNAPHEIQNHGSIGNLNFDVNSSKLHFVKSFIDAKHAQNLYLTFLNENFHFKIDEAEINRLIKPFFKLDPLEIEKICDLAWQKMDDIYGH